MIMAQIIFIIIIIYLFAMAFPVILVGLAIFGIVQLYLYFYYKSDNFINIKKSITKYVDDCNELNDHISEIWLRHKRIKRADSGVATVIDTSAFNFKRSNYSKITDDDDVYNCSLSVCRNAQAQPFAYLCKYFNLPPSEETLSRFESLLESIASIEDGKKYLNIKRDKIINRISHQIPWVVKKFDNKRLMKKLGFQEIKLKQSYYPSYIFRYVSPGGNSSQDVSIIFDQEMTDRFITYLSEKIKWRKSIAGQRALMTSALRTEIKERDKYSCKKCRNSIKKEPNLLLEIDHITPLAKGGMTTKSNLQTLCWRCNRTKGAKIEYK